MQARWLLLALVFGCSAGQDGPQLGFGSASGDANGTTGVGATDTRSSGSATGTAESGSGSASSGEAETDTISSSGASTTTVDCESTSFYPDVDMDGFGDPELGMAACDAPAGFIPIAGDCEDEDPAINPDALEICDGEDQDCDGLVDEFSELNPSCSGCTTAQRDGQVYWLCTNDPLSWFGAQSACSDRGAELTSIQDFVEYSFLLSNIPAQDHWIGLNDLVAENDYEWSDGSLVDYTRWAAGEPNNQDNSEDCAEFDASKNMDWNDNECETAAGYICEATDVVAR